MTPALWFAATLALYAGADWLHQKTGRQPWAHPVLIPVIILAVAVGRSHDLAAYREGTVLFGWLLAAAVAALALPLYRNFDAIRREPFAVLCALAGGSVAGVGSALAVAHALKASPDMMASLASKSITTPMAIMVAETIGGVPALAAAIVIVTGLVAAIFGPWFLRLIGVDDDVTMGIALGTAGHALGMAEATHRSELMGAAAAFAMAANGLLTALIIPVLWRL